MRTLFVVLSIMLFIITPAFSESVPSTVFTYATMNLAAGNRCPVYSAPDENSLRGANGKAVVSTDSEIDVFGTSGDYLLIRYNISSGHDRFGYIASSALPIGSQITPMVFESIPCHTRVDANVTDDPFGSQAVLSTLSTNTSLIYLAAWAGWAYVQCEAPFLRGFVPLADIVLPTDSVPEGVSVVDLSGIVTNSIPIPRQTVEIENIHSFYTYGASYMVANTYPQMDEGVWFEYHNMYSSAHYITLEKIDLTDGSLISQCPLARNQLGGMDIRAVMGEGDTLLLGLTEFKDYIDTGSVALYTKATKQYRLFTLPKKYNIAAVATTDNSILMVGAVGPELHLLEVDASLQIVMDAKLPLEDTLLTSLGLPPNDISYYCSLTVCEDGQTALVTLFATGSDNRTLICGLNRVGEALFTLLLPCEASPICYQDNVLFVQCKEREAVSLCALTQNGEALWHCKFEQQDSNLRTLVLPYQSALYVAVFSDSPMLEQSSKLHALYVLNNNGSSVFSAAMDYVGVDFICLTLLDNLPTLIGVSYEQYTNKPWICVVPLDFTQNK